MRRFILCLLVGAALLPVAGLARDRSGDRDKPFAWRDQLVPRDRNRLRNWRQAWINGLAEARAQGASAAIATEGRLLDPDAAANDPVAPDGAYLCRTIKLGGGHGLVQAPASACRIVDGRFTQTEGPQRLGGTLWHYDGVRMLFLGALALNDERATLPYGRDPDRDALGLFERIGDRRWRLVIPNPAWEAKVIVVEILPAP